MTPKRNSRMDRIPEELYNQANTIQKKLQEQLRDLGVHKKIPRTEAYRRMLKKMRDNGLL